MRITLPRRFILLILPGVIVFVLLVTVLRDQTNTFIVRPSLISIRYVSRMLMVFNQKIVWISFLIIFTLVFLWSLVSFARKRKVTDKNPGPNFSRLAFWQSYLSGINKGDYLKLRFGQRISSLLIQALSMKYNLPVESFPNRVEQAGVQLPDRIIEYLEITNQPYARIGIEQINRGYGRKKEKLNKEILNTVTPEMITAYLEEELMISPIEQQNENYG